MKAGLQIHLRTFIKISKQMFGEKIGVNFIEHDDNDLKSLIGKKMAFDYWDIMSKLNLHYIDVGQNDKIDYYGNKEVDICLRFEEDWDDDRRLLELTDVYRYPKCYEKSKEQVNKELILANAIGLALKKEVGSLLSTGNSIDDNTFNDCQIDAYLMLKENNKLLS